MCVCERERQRVLVCERERDRVCVCVRERDRECLCARERETECVCVCERERERVHQLSGISKVQCSVSLRPFWLSPAQVMVVPVGSSSETYGQEVRGNTTLNKLN